MDTTKRSFVQNDQMGLTNTRLLSKGERVDYTRVEGASLKMMSRLLSPEGKRLFLRLFGTVQLQLNFIGGVARAVMDASVIDPLVDAIKVRTDDLHKALNAAIDGAEVLFKQHGIVNIASYDTPPLEVEVPILSAQSRRYYEAIVKFDQLMPLLQTLQIHEVVTDANANESRARLKTDFRAIAATSRRMADRLRTRLFQESKEGETPSSREAMSAAQPGKLNEHRESGKGETPRLSANARKRRNRRAKREAAERARLAAATDATGQGALEVAGGGASMPERTSIQEDSQAGDARRELLCLGVAMTDYLEQLESSADAEGVH